ncbi:MAG: GtrA family protein [Gammaproteobacteria bacterium]|nr:GtrA family protein [Gammaproteobacteria bacterium]
MSRDRSISAESTIATLFRYGVAGIVGTLAHYAVLLGMVEYFGLSVLIATSTGFVLGAVVNHELNRRFVFDARGKSYGHTAIKFMIIAVVGFCINLAAMFVLNILFALQYIVAQVLATGLVFLITFLLNKSWTFGT